jgi:small neutral amino acid transporter SnatA (MarC family)
MTEQQLLRALKHLYLLAALYTGFGFVFFLLQTDVRQALAFVLGALASAGNLWLFAWLARTISPAESKRTVWPASLYAGRFLVLFFIGYVIVKLLGASAIAVIAGLLVSTAAVMTLMAIQLFQTIIGDQPTH